MYSPCHSSSVNHVNIKSTKNIVMECPLPDYRGGRVKIEVATAYFIILSYPENPISYTNNTKQFWEAQEVYFLLSFI